MEMCKAFAQDYAKYALYNDDGSDEGKDFTKYAKGLTGRRRREALLSYNPFSI